MSRLRTTFVVAAGLVLIASSAAHSLLGWPPLLARLTAENAPLDLISGLAMGWHFAGLAMLTLGPLAAAALGFDFVEIVFLTPGALLTAAALIPDR